jgi:hypothetical protein
MKIAKIWRHIALTLRFRDNPILFRENSAGVRPLFFANSKLLDAGGNMIAVFIVTDNGLCVMLP